MVVLQSFHAVALVQGSFVRSTQEFPKFIHQKSFWSSNDCLPRRLADGPLQQDLKFLISRYVRFGEVYQLLKPLFLFLMQTYFASLMEKPDFSKRSCAGREQTTEIQKRCPFEKSSIFFVQVFHQVGISRPAIILRVVVLPS